MPFFARVRRLLWRAAMFVFVVLLIVLPAPVAVIFAAAREKPLRQRAVAAQVLKKEETPR